MPNIPRTSKENHSEMVSVGVSFPRTSMFRVVGGEPAAPPASLRSKLKGCYVDRRFACRLWVTKRRHHSFGHIPCSERNLFHQPFVHSSCVVTLSPPASPLKTRGFSRPRDLLVWSWSSFHALKPLSFPRDLVVPFKGTVMCSTLLCRYQEGPVVPSEKALGSLG